MVPQGKSGLQFFFYAAFIMLTVLVWCPLGYGQYGEVGLIFGMPIWAAVAMALGALLFLLEWIYLFMTDLALDDESLPNIMSELEMLHANATKSTREVN